MTADIGKVTIPITFSDSEGTSGTKNVEVTVSRIKPPTPVISVNLNPQSQTVDAKFNIFISWDTIQCYIKYKRGR